MQRNMDLVRAILLAVEKHPEGFAPHDLRIDGYTEEQIGYHSALLKDAGLVEGLDNTTVVSTSPSAIITRLTWNGHEFISSARSPTIWAQAKELMMKVGGGSLQVWQSVLTELVKRSVGLG